MSDLVGNLEDRFSHNEAHIYIMLIRLSVLEPFEPHSYRSIVKLGLTEDYTVFA